MPSCLVHYSSSGVRRSFCCVALLHVTAAVLPYCRLANSTLALARSYRLGRCNRREALAAVPGRCRARVVAKVVRVPAAGSS